MANEILHAEIARLRSIVKESIDSTELQVSFYNSISQLEKKDKKGILNVAVAGEFNSGKSTFINALLRERLLKEAVMPTTAAATYIKRAKSTGLFFFLKKPKDCVSVSFDSGESFVFTNKKTASIIDYLQSQYGIDCPNNLKYIIGVLTAEQSVSKHVVGIELQLNNKVIPERFNIIDTPGFNPGSMSFDNHMSIAKDVVSKVADMSIILMPSTSVMSSSLMTFLQEESINRYLHRCILIITKIDCIDKSERNSVVNYVKQNLMAIGVKTPIVYTTSAMSVLPVHKIPTSLADEWQSFKDGFVAMEENLWDTVEKYRELAIYEHCLNILKDISSELTNSISKKITSQKEALRILQENTIKRIQDLTDDEYKRASIEVNGYFSSMSISPSSYIDSAQYKVYSIIRKGGKLRHFRRDELPQIEEAVNKYTQEYINDVNGNLKQSLQVFSQQINHFKQVFHSHYKDMPALEPKIDDDSQKAVAVNTRYEPRSNDTVDYIGGWWHRISGWFRDEREIQDEAISNINSTISTYFYKLSDAISVQKDEINKVQIALLKRYCDQHVQQYGKRVEKLIKKQTRQKDTLTTKVSFLRNKIEELDLLKKRIEKEIEQSIKKGNGNG